MKTVRFSQLVAQCGRPVPHTQWLDPAADRELKAAEKGHKLLTALLQNVGAKKDHGEVGLVESAHRSLLIFPKSLQAFADRKVVGINPDLIDQGPTEERKTKTPPKRTTGPLPSAPPSFAKALEVEGYSTTKPVRAPVPQRDAVPATPIAPKAKPKTKATGNAKKEGSETTGSLAAIKQALKLLKGYDTSGAIKILESVVKSVP